MAPRTSYLHRQPWVLHSSENNTAFASLGVAVCGAIFAAEKKEPFKTSPRSATNSYIINHD